MRVWLRLTHLFGLPNGNHPDNLMQAALGPVLRAACQDIVYAPLPEPVARLAQEFAQREWPNQSIVNGPIMVDVNGRVDAIQGQGQGQGRGRYRSLRRGVALHAGAARADI
jgi:hypothetical protein